MTEALPGLSAIEREVSKFAQRLAQQEWGEEVFLWVWHLLKQASDRDRGSGFGVHTDTADDAPPKRRNDLLLSITVKLNDDPEGSEGSWMQVVGHAPVRFGAPAGSTLAFESNRPHLSTLTPSSSRTTLKVVFFYMRAAKR